MQDEPYHQNSKKPKNKTEEKKQPVNKSNEKQKYQKKFFNYARYSSMWIQMVVIIIAGVFGGYKLDEAIGLQFPIFTIVLSLAAVSISIYLMIKNL